MSWPADGRPRFKAGSCDRGSKLVDANPAPQGYVYDRAYSHRIVVAIPSLTRKIALARAEAEAAYLEEDHRRAPRRALFPRLPGEHGAVGYEKGGCRCEVCTTAHVSRGRDHRAKKRAAAA